MKKLLLSISAIFILTANLCAQTKTSGEDKSANCGGVERWAVKVLTDSKVNTIDFNPISTTVAELVSMPTPKPGSSMPRLDGIEDRTYKLICKITIKKTEADSDYHLVLSDGTNTFIGEVPNPVCATAATSAYVDQYIAVRNFIDSYIPYANTSKVNLPDVEVTGVAFLDPPHGQTGKAPNNIEFHPILDLRFADMTGNGELRTEKVLTVNLSPNPAHDKLAVNINSTTWILKDCSLQIFDIHSNLVKVFQLPVSGNTSISQVLDINTIAAGVYIYRILNKGKGIYDGKLVVERG